MGEDCEVTKRYGFKIWSASCWVSKCTDYTQLIWICASYIVDEQNRGRP